ncbi:MULTISPECIES: hypothetical protein [Azospirillum]|uniref:hypothetical protein n=1 Tax=Azospirillum TaxID=191 RepID=UPI001304840E|nr:MULTISPECIES: hypothetical protein [Azospirillum]UKJ78226.1 hypothetical protein H1Q64_33150 [Azospirillum brasilense]
MVRPGLGLKSYHTARQTIAGEQIVAIVRYGQVAAAPINTIPAPSPFIEALFGAIT